MAISSPFWGFMTMMDTFLAFFLLQHLVSQLLRIFLYIHIQADVKIIARYGFNPVLCGILYLHTLCIGHGEYLSVHSFQIFLVFYFQADNALVVSPVNPKTLDARLS